MSLDGGIPGTPPVNRETTLESWVQRQLSRIDDSGPGAIQLQPLSGDASFRRYFRVSLPAASYVVVDAPPDSEDNETFVRIADEFRAAGVMTPRILAADYGHGFMLQEDFGDGLYLQALQQARQAAGPDQPVAEQVLDLYRRAIDTLVLLQKNVSPEKFPPYDGRLLHREMQLFQDWFCERFLALKLTAEERRLILESQEFLANAALAQPRVVVHRDYHSRNLMIPDPRRYPADAAPGVIDFQDAVAGAYTYDLVSLLRDCYISWPRATVESLARYYLTNAAAAGVAGGIDEARFFRDLDLMGLQRHMKVIGIFARLCIRDGKSGFLADIPQTIDYFTRVAANYGELDQLLDWFECRVQPAARRRLPGMPS